MRSGIEEGLQKVHDLSFREKACEKGGGGFSRIQVAGRGKGLSARRGSKGRGGGLRNCDFVV